MELNIGLIFVIIYLTIPLFLYIFQRLAEPSKDDLNRKTRVIVLVLGDLARSPRMLYHARSLAKGNVEVDLCGYDGKFRLSFGIANSLVVEFVNTFF